MHFEDKLAYYSIQASNCPKRELEKNTFERNKCPRSLRYKFQDKVYPWYK